MLVTDEGMFYKRQGNVLYADNGMFFKWSGEDRQNIRSANVKCSQCLYILTCDRSHVFKVSWSLSLA